MIFSRCTLPFCVDSLGDFLNYDFYTLRNHTESRKKSWTKNMFSKFRKVFRKNIFEKCFGKFLKTIPNIFKILKIGNAKIFKIEKFQFLKILTFSIFKISKNFAKKIENFPKICSKIFFSENFSNFWKHIFCSGFFSWLGMVT